ncbi:hypothetical protein N2152v2_008005 [Parachlorella kessleri]
MSSAWRFVAYYALPIPMILLVLLNIPAPRVFRRGVLQFVERVFGLRMVGAFQLLHVMLFLTGMALVSSLRVLHNLRQQEVGAVWPTANSELTHLSRRWRAERNTWIAAFAFTMWCVLSAFYREAVRRIKLEERLEALQGTPAGGPTPGPRRARPEPAAGVREEPVKVAPASNGPTSTGPASTSAPAAPVERVVAKAPAAAVEPAGGIQLQEFKKEL